MCEREYYSNVIKQNSKFTVGCDENIGSMELGQVEAQTISLEQMSKNCAILEKYLNFLNYI